MTHISSESLEAKLSQKLFEDLATCFVKLNKNTAPEFLGALLTKTEQIMVAKRVAVIVLLREGCSVYHIADVLHMSTSTVSDMADKYKKGKYDGLVKVLKWSKEERERFWDTLEVILRGGLPRRVGKRWDWLGAMRPHQ